MDLETITKQINDRETARFNFKGTVTITTTNKTPCFSGSIDTLTTSRIELAYNPLFIKKTVPKIKKIVKKPFEHAFTALIDHELNHKGGGEFKGCPRNIDIHVEHVLDPMSETLQNLGFSNTPLSSNQTLYSYFANMLEDVIDNFELGMHSDGLGMFSIYKDDAVHMSAASKGIFPPLFEAFLQLQQKLYGGIRSDKLLKNHFSNDEKVLEVVNNFLERTGIGKYTHIVNARKRIKGKRKKVSKVAFDRKQSLNHMLDEKNWAEISGIFAEEFSKLVDKKKLPNPEYIKKNFVPLKGETDNFPDEMDDENTKMKFAWKKYQESKKPGTGKEKPRRSNSFKPPAYMDKTEALDLVYQRRARNMEIKTNSSTSTTAMPVVWYGRRPFNPLQDKISKAKVGLGKDARLELRMKRFHEDHSVEFTEKRPGLPKIRFIKRDDSGSMRSKLDPSKKGIVMNPWAPESQQWTDNSMYNQSLIAEWSLYELLRRQGELKRASVKSVSYSTRTRVATNLKESKRQALTPTFGGNTILDMDTLDKLFSRRELVISISDGQIHNWKSTLSNGNTVKEEYIKRAKQNDYFHIQIGGATTMSKDLEEAGIFVKHDTGENLAKIVIDLTRPYLTRSNR